MSFLFLTQAAVRPFVVKSIDWEVRRSRARSAAMPPMAGESLKPWPEKPARRALLAFAGHSRSLPQ
jgi:hypothetical protein